MIIEKNLELSGSGDIILENEYLRYMIGVNGQSKSFIDKVQGKEYLSVEGEKAFMSICNNGKVYQSTSILYNKSLKEIHIEFGDTKVIVVTKVRIEKNYFAFEVTSVKGENVNSLTLCQLSLIIQGEVGETVGVVRDKRFAAGIQALHYRMDGGARGENKRVILWVRCSSEYGKGIPGCSYALFGCPKEKALNFIGIIEEQENLPHPILAGQWAKISPESSKSYLVVDFTEDNIDEVIRYAQAAGLSYIYHLDPFKTWGHWFFNEKQFSHGIEGFKETVEKARKAGLKVGIHTLSGGITINDPYVTPIPDTRLEKLGMAKLGKNIDENTTTIPFDGVMGISNKSCTVNNDDCVSLDRLKAKDRIESIFQGSGVIQIGEELIQFKELVIDKLPKLRGCVRGIYNTHVTTHKRGETIFRLSVNSYAGFVPEVDSSLLEEMAERMAHIFNYCGLSQISFDGWEWHSYIKGYYGKNKYLNAVYKRWKVPVIADASNNEHYGWHVFSRFNWGELMQNPRADINNRRVNHMAYFKRNMIPPAMGWWRLGLALVDWEATTLDDIEFLLAKCAGHGACFCIQTKLDTLKNHGQTETILSTVREWERARHAKAFSKEQRERMNGPDNEFHLKRLNSKKWQLTPIDFSPAFWYSSGKGRIAKVTNNHLLSFMSKGVVRSGDRWEIENKFAEQPLRFTLRTLRAFDYDEERNISLMPPVEKLTLYPDSTRRAPSIVVKEEKGKECAIKLVGNYHGEGRSTAARLIYYFPEPLDLTKHRAIGLWIEGDAKGELFFIEFQDTGGIVSGKLVRQFYFPITFSRKHYLEIPIGEACSTRYYEYEWSNCYAPPCRALKGFRYSNVEAITLGYNSISAHTEVSCTVVGIKALREIESAVVNPSFEANGKKVIFPVELKPEEHLVCEGHGEGFVYDANWHLLKKVQTNGILPKLFQGKQLVKFNYEFSGKSAPWVRIRFKTLGETETVR